MFPKLFLPGASIIFSDKVLPNVVKSGLSVLFTDLTEPHKRIPVVPYSTCPYWCRYHLVLFRFFAKTGLCLRLDGAMSLKWAFQCF